MVIEIVKDLFDLFVFWDLLAVQAPKFSNSNQGQDGGIGSEDFQLATGYMCRNSVPYLHHSQHIYRCPYWTWWAEN